MEGIDMVNSTSRRNLLRALAGGAAGLVLASLNACGAAPAPTATTAAQAQSSPQPSQATPAAQAGQEVTLEFWHGFNAHEVDALNKMIDEHWTPDHPGIKIHSKGETGPDAILTAMSGGTPPDVAILWDPNSVTLWARQGAIKNLTPFVEKSQMDLSQFVPAALAWTQYKGQTYGLPFVDFNLGFFWNKALFKEAGLDPDKAPASIDELRTYAEKLTKKDDSGKITQIGWLANGTDQYISLALAFGGKFYNAQSGEVTANDPKNVAALQWDLGVAKDFGLTEVSNFASGFTGEEGNNPFFLGKAAMTIDGCWQPAFIKQYAPNLDYGVAGVPPADPAYANSSNVMTNPIVIPNAVKHPDESWEFAKWLGTDPQVSKEFSQLVANIPQLKSVLQGYSTDPKVQVFVDLSNSPNATAWAPLPVTSVYYDELSNAVSSVFAGQAEPQPALDAVQQKVSAELDKIK
jgi:multiple sugar transport system substrate-binding protein